MRGGSLTKCLRKYLWDWPVINHLRILQAASRYARNYVSPYISRRHETRPEQRDEITPRASLNELLFFFTKGIFPSLESRRNFDVDDTLVDTKIWKDKRKIFSSKPFRGKISSNDIIKI